MAGQAKQVPGTTIKIRLQTDGSITAWGFRVTSVVAAGASPGSGTLPESAHPYANNFDYTWTYTYPGSAAAVSVTFDSRTAVEESWDWIYVMDGNGTNIPSSPFTGTQLAGQTKQVPGSTVKIRLRTDGSVTGWGFRMTAVVPALSPDLGIPTLNDFLGLTNNAACGNAAYAELRFRNPPARYGIFEYIKITVTAPAGSYITSIVPIRSYAEDVDRWAFGAIASLIIDGVGELIPGVSFGKTLAEAASGAVSLLSDPRRSRPTAYEHVCNYACSNMDTGILFQFTSTRAPDWTLDVRVEYRRARPQSGTLPDPSWLQGTLAGRVPLRCQ